MSTATISCSNATTWLSGATPEVMASTPANVGSCALSAFVFHRAGQPDPVDLLGAMFVIEGLGLRKAGFWADRLQAYSGCVTTRSASCATTRPGTTSISGVLRAALRSGAFDAAAMARIVKTAG